MVRMVELRFYLSVGLLFLVDQLILFAVPLILYDQTKSVEVSSFAYAAEWSVRIGGGFVVKSVIDRWGCSKAIFVTEFLRSILAIVLVAQLLWFEFNSVAIALVGCFFAFFNTIATVAISTWIAESFAKERFSAVDAMVSMMDQLGMLAGPGIASILWMLLPIWGIPAVSSLLLVIVSFLFRSLSSKTPASTCTFADNAKKGPFTLFDAHRLVWSDSGLVFCLVGAFFLNALISMAEAMGPHMLTNQLGHSASWLALMNTAAGLLGVVALPWSPRLVKNLGCLPLRFLTLGFSILGVGIMAIAGHPVTWILGFSVLIAGTLVGGVAYRSYRIEVVSAHMLTAVVSYMWTFGQLGSVLFSAMVGILNPYVQAQEQFVLAGGLFLGWWLWNLTMFFDRRQLRSVS